jgi:transcriptional regulator with XRE-family HTH domain
MCVVKNTLMTSDELESLLGANLRALRIRQNVTQRDLALRANVSLGAVQHAESGRGATVRTLVRMLKALGRTDWIDALSPQVSVSPLEVLKSGRRAKRQRASVPRAARNRDV